MSVLPVHQVQKRVSDPLALELRLVVNRCVGAGAARGLNCRTISLASSPVFFDRLAH